jgi:hypothetical protein
MGITFNKRQPLGVKSILNECQNDPQEMSTSQSAVHWRALFPRFNTNTFRESDVVTPIPIAETRVNPERLVSPFIEARRPDIVSI